MKKIKWLGRSLDREREREEMYTKRNTQNSRGNDNKKDSYYTSLAVSLFIRYRNSFILVNLPINLSSMLDIILSVVFFFLR